MSINFKEKTSNFQCVLVTLMKLGKVCGPVLMQHCIMFARQEFSLLRYIDVVSEAISVMFVYNTQLHCLCPFVFKSFQVSMI
jgi:hypothetical protein